MSPTPAPGATVTVVLTDRDGTVAARRRAHNAVLSAGAALVADLFRGADGAGPVNRMGVGADPNPEVPPFGTTALSGSDDATGTLSGPREVALGADAFTVAVDADGRRVTVSARVVLPAGDENALHGPVAEAALLNLAGDTRRLYHRVTFEPVEKRTDQELSLYWEVVFPFGDPD
jgi:hypothetical protein